MADDKTQTLGNGGSFEDLILARLDAMDARYAQFEEMSKQFYSTMSRDSQEHLVALQIMINELGSRVLMMETLVEKRLKEIRPIWEKGLAEIMATREEVKALPSKIDILNEDVLSVRAKQREADLRLKELESFLHRA